MDEFFNNYAMLIWQEDELIKEQWTLNQDRMMLGRDSSCEIAIGSRWISRVHAKIERDGPTYVLSDAGSKNGVFVNGERVYTKRVLLDGDKIQLAPSLDLIFVDSEATAPLPGRIVEMLRLDPETRQIYIKGKLLSPPLSLQQYLMLELLASNPGKVYSRYEVITAAWPDDHEAGVSDDAVDAMVRRLRQRLATLDPDHEYVVTVRGYGFKLDLSE
jgi:DNA-binding response OmpR family regulator